MSAKPPTIKDVASKAGVSFKTVSRVINRQPSVRPDIREAVEAAMLALNYRPDPAARALRSKRSYSIALLSGWRTDPPGPFGGEERDEPRFSEFFSELSIGCGAACRDNAYHLIFDFIAYGDRPKALMAINSLLDTMRPDGLLLCPPLCDLPWLLDLLEERKVRYARLLPGSDLGRSLAFKIDDFEAAAAMTGLLLEAGHRRLAMITGPGDHLAANERLNGFRQAAARTEGTQFEVAEGNFTMTGGKHHALKLLGSPDRPTAIFAANDATAAGVITVAMELGLSIPQDLSVAGFDDAMIARMTNPPLTTVRQPVFDMARRAAEMLIEWANSGEAPQERLINLEYRITQRKSVAAPPQTVRNNLA